MDEAEQLWAWLGNEVFDFGIRWAVVRLAMLIFGGWFGKRYSSMKSQVATQGNQLETQRNQLETLEEQHRSQSTTQSTQKSPAVRMPEQPEALEPDVATITYIEACGIVRAYIEPAMQDMRDRIQLTMTHEFVERFSETTGAMLGPGQYNRVRLRQWIESNAARFLVEHRGAMR